jgi:hypothetical protein
MNNIFKKLLEEFVNQTDMLVEEFSNASPDEHGWGIDVKFHIMQPSDKRLQHGARIKVFRQSWASGDNFTITISDEPQVIGDYSKVVTTKELNVLLFKVKKYRSALLSFWNNPNMSMSELRTAMDNIDRRTN